MPRHAPSTLSRLLLKTFALAMVGAGLLLALAQPAAAQSRRERFLELHQRLSGRRSLEFEIVPVGQVASHGDEAHSAFGAEWDDLYPDPAGFQMQAKYHHPLTGWLTAGPTLTYRMLQCGGDDFWAPAGFLEPDGLRLHRVMAGAFVRLQPGSPLRKVRFSFTLSAQVGLGVFEETHTYWNEAGPAPRVRGTLFEQTGVFTFETQARLALTFRSLDHVRWGPNFWLGWNWTGAPDDSHTAMPGWRPAAPDPWRSVTIGGGLTFEVLWGSGLSAGRRLAEDSRGRSYGRRLHPVR